MNLKSSRIKSAEYNDSTEVLTIEFAKGGRYKYYSVPKHLYSGLINSTSPGTYFDSHIKSKYNYKKA